MEKLNFGESVHVHKKKLKMLPTNAWDEYKLNYPIQGTLNCVNHIAFDDYPS